MIEKDVDITRYTTFNIPVKAKYFAEYDSLKALKLLMRDEIYRTVNIFHIGGGSNLLFTSDFNGLILHSKIKGIEQYRKDENTVYVIAGAGEKWSDLVDWCVENGLAGLENMAGIPGEVGSSPIQNVGAYGREAKDVIFTVECYDTLNHDTVKLTNAQCRFGYRDSIFKHDWKNRFYVLRVSFKLTPSTEAKYLDYGPLKNFKEKLGRTPTISDVASEVKKIRDSKLPDPTKIGSAGSFFKNPVINEYYFKEEVLPKAPDIVWFPAGEGKVKVSAGWLIEHTGLKGMSIGGAEVWPQQCLVIANTGGASAKEVEQLSSFIQKEVDEKYAVKLRPEVNFVSTDINVTVLGSGTSKGVPEVGCNCKVCTSLFPEDKRLRASVLVRTAGINILIDPSPDFRQQALRENLGHIDAVLVTHSHYDHVGGFDDLRPLCTNHDITVYLRKDVNEDLHRRIDYCFREHPYPGVPRFNMVEIPNEPFFVEGVEITPVEVMHGKLPIYGYRIGNFAYITDAKTIPEMEMEKLYGLDTLIINALRKEEHFAHLNVQEALDIIAELKPRRAFLTHMNHQIGLASEIDEMLPPNVRFAYDGLQIHIQ